MRCVFAFATAIASSTTAHVTSSKETTKTTESSERISAEKLSKNIVHVAWNKFEIRFYSTENDVFFPVTDLRRHHLL